MNPIRLPTSRAALAWLYAYCAWREGVTITYNARGWPVQVQGPKLACISYLERMRSLPPPPQAPPRKKGARRRLPRS